VSHKYLHKYLLKQVWKSKLYNEKISQGLPATIGIDHESIAHYNELKKVNENFNQDTLKSDLRKLRREFGGLQGSSLTQFSSMNFRKKKVKFMRSLIHGWGLFTLEDIPANQMVIEYLGETIRLGLCDHREEYNEKHGEESSYMFRVDKNVVVDATRHGNYARFINHSCEPNCTAKIIVELDESKIVIYSKREIKAFEEITYDYKFPIGSGFFERCFFVLEIPFFVASRTNLNSPLLPIEENKIPCWCGAQNCRKYLN